MGLELIGVACRAGLDESEKVQIPVEMVSRAVGYSDGIFAFSGRR